MTLERRMKKRTKRQRRTREDIFALKTNPSRLRRRTKATEKLMDEAEYGS